MNSLLKPLISVSGWTIISRLFGLVRELVQAHLIGASAVMDALAVAMRFPSMFRKLFAEGAMNAAFVPSLSALYSKNKDDEAINYINNVHMILALLVLGFVIFCEILLPLLLPIITVGFDAQRYNYTLSFTRLTMPFLFFISLNAFYSGVLNAKDRFWMAAASPAVGNIAFVLVLLMGVAHEVWWGPNTIVFNGYYVSIGVTVCGIFQFLWTRQGISNLKINPKFGVPIINNEVYSFLKKMAIGIMGSGVSQINLAIDTIFASYLPQGGVSYLYYAERLMQLPLSTVGTALGTALLPFLAKYISAGDMENANKTSIKSLHYACLFGLPATMILFVLAEPITYLLYEHGKFSHTNTIETATTLQMLSLGLPAFIVSKIFNATFFANHDMKTPFYISCVNIVSNIILVSIFMPIMQHQGMALAFSINSWLHVAMLWVLLHRKKWIQINLQFIAQMGSLIALVLLSALTCFFLWKYIPFYEMNNWSMKASITILNALVSIGTFALISWKMNLIKFK